MKSRNAGVISPTVSLHQVVSNHQVDPDGLRLPVVLMNWKEVKEGEVSVIRTGRDD